jgi:hypothetical protein
MVGNSLSFPMVHNMVPNGSRFMSYNCRKLDRLAESGFWADWTFRSNSGIWQNIAMTFPETLNTKVADKELSFPLVTHMACSDARFGNYGILIQDKVLETFWTDCRPANDQVLGAEDARNLTRVLYKFRRPLTQLSNAYSHTHFL